VLLGVLLAAAFYGWQTVISPARENDKQADAGPECEKVAEFRKGDVIRPDDIVVNVYNAGTEPGAAGDTLDQLVNRGFARGEADNAPADVRTRTVVVVTDDKKDPTVKLVSNQFKGKVRYVNVDMEAPGISIVIGNDFKGIDRSAKKTLKIKADISSCTESSASASG
jgi:hypothetical protein